MQNNSKIEWPIELILEAGVNHEGLLENALKMIEQAAQLNVKAIKFQTYNANTLASKNSPSYWDTNKESATNQYDLFSKFDKFSLQDYKIMWEACKSQGIEFATTVFSLDLLDSLDEFLNFYKIASADLTNYSLVREIAKRKKPIILSTGASTFDEIKDTLYEIYNLNANAEITLLHCVLNYPTEISNANILRIKHLESSFPSLVIGYSDHTISENSKFVVGLAVALGAKVVETHFTLNKNWKGNDHYHALDFEDVLELNSYLKLTNDALVYSENRFLEVQTLARKFARRGVYAARKIPQHKIVTYDDLICLRPQVEGSYTSEQIDSIVGKKTVIDIQAGESITFSSIN